MRKSSFKTQCDPEKQKGGLPRPSLFTEPAAGYGLQVDFEGYCISNTLSLTSICKGAPAGSKKITPTRAVVVGVAGTVQM